MYNKYRITVVVLMIVRSSRMQRTRTIAAAIKSIYYARVCYIRATYSLLLSISFSLSPFHSLVYPCTLIRSLSLSFSLSLFLFFFPFTLSPYCKFLLVLRTLPHLIFFYLYFIIIIIVIFIVSVIIYSAESHYCFLP